MSGPENLGWVLFPYVLAVVLIGGAMGGSFLKPSARKWLERFLLKPLLVLFLVGGAAVAASRHDWLLLVAALVILALTAFRGFEQTQTRSSESANTTGISG